jgi:hypothetical protein
MATTIFNLKVAAEDSGPTIYASLFPRPNAGWNRPLP